MRPRPRQPRTAPGGQPDSDFIAGGYDLTEDNLAAIQDGFADVAIGQTPFMQGYLPVYMLVDALRNGTELELSFVDAGTEIVTADRVIEPFGLPELTFDELLELAASPEAAREYYQPLVDGVIAEWQDTSSRSRPSPSRSAIWGRSMSMAIWGTFVSCADAPNVPQIGEGALTH